MEVCGSGTPDPKGGHLKWIVTTCESHPDETPEDREVEVDSGGGGRVGGREDHRP